MALLKADEIGNAKDFEEATVEVPEWGGDVRVRTLPMGARYEINKRAIKGEGEGAKMDNAVFAAASLEFGIIEPKLTREQAEKIVAERAPEAINRIVAQIWKLSGVKEKEAKNG